MNRAETFVKIMIICCNWNLARASQQVRQAPTLTQDYCPGQCCLIILVVHRLALHGPIVRPLEGVGDSALRRRRLAT